jgi:DUF4097 and DUF4098 domain-containing protein YvlB
MREKNRSVLRLLAVVACCALAGALAPTSQAAFEKAMSLSADTVEIRNLIGEIEVEGHRGSDFEIEVRVQGSDATPDRVEIRVEEGRRADVTILFPLDESKRYVYPRLNGGNVSFSANDDSGSWLSKLFGAIGNGNIKVRGSGSGLEIWADVTVRVPRGKSVVIDNGVGTVVARDVDADLNLATNSGHVEVTGATGSVSVDTGSGHVTVAHVEGPLHLDTGSGHVSVTDVEAKSVHVDTGSGHVDLDDVDSSTVYVDTGSGRVEARAVSADDLVIDTGSGSVTLQLERMGGGEFVIDTGSGGIDLRLPPDASADVKVDTGSGGIELDLTGSYRMRHQEEDEAEFTIGGGDADVMLDTGSGSVRISQ